VCRRHGGIEIGGWSVKEEELSGEQVFGGQDWEVRIAVVPEGHEAHTMSIVDGEGIGTIFLLGGHGCDQGGLTAFPAFPRSHLFGDQ